MRVRTRLEAAIATTAAIALVAVAASAAVTQPRSGAKYKGTVKGGSVSLKVKPQSRARVAFLVKSKCGHARDTVTVKMKRGRFRSSGGANEAGVSGRFVAGGLKAIGTLNPAAAKRAGGLCNVGPRRFTARLAGPPSAVGLGGSALRPSDYGHYAGSNAGGRAVSFDVVPGPGEGAIENFAVDVDTECWGDYDHDGANDSLLAHISGFGEEIDERGGFDIYYAPDEDTEFEFQGTIKSGAVAVDVTAGGRFNPDGTPNLFGTFECDSWGDTYDALNQG